MTVTNRAMVAAGILTIFQAAGQILLTALALLQYFCIIDFLREIPTLLFIKILYFHNPSTCNVRIPIGHTIEGMVDQAFVLLINEPFTTTRTFYINCINLALGFLWLLTCFGIMRGGAKQKQSKIIRWPWLMVTVLVCGVDLAATVTYASDLFHTRSLEDILNYIGGTGSGIGSTDVVTWWAPWIMIMIYSRFVVLFSVNLILIVIVVIHVSAKRMVENMGIQVEAQTVTNDEETSATDLKENAMEREEPSSTVIPRPNLSQAFSTMKARLFGNNLFVKAPPPEQRRALTQIESGSNSSNATPGSSPRVHVDMDKKRTVNFPENLLSLPQRLENMIAEQQQQLDKSIDTSQAGRSHSHTPPRALQILPQLTSHAPETNRGGTAAELQGQRPWAYIPASGHPMRDQLPSDEDLPPVPLPDYTAFPSYRKAYGQSLSLFEPMVTKKSLPSRSEELTKSAMLNRLRLK